MDHFFLLMFRVCIVFLSVQCSPMITCLERADLLALLYVIFYCFVTFPCGALGQVGCLIVSIADLCLLSYFGMVSMTFLSRDPHFVHSRSDYTELAEEF